MTSFADRVISFNKNLKLSASLPDGISAMNPFGDKPAIEASSKFYQKFYNDNNQRHLIAGINPGRFGAGVTGIPFTDTKRLQSKCGISFGTLATHEPSSVFVYEVVDAFGGAEEFFSKFYINSVCPLGFTAKTEKSKEVNYNYYDDKKLTESVTPFIVKCLRKQISFGLETNVCFCMGTGKNFTFLNALNDKHKFFGKIVPLEHPRYVMQYKSKKKSHYVKKYLDNFKEM